MSFFTCLPFVVDVSSQSSSSCCQLFQRASPHHVLTTSSTVLMILFPTGWWTIWVPDRFSTLFPTDFSTMFQTDFFEHAPGIIPEPVPIRSIALSGQETGDARPVRSAKLLPASPSRSNPTVSKLVPFTILSLGKTQNEIRLRRANRLTSRTERCLRYRAYTGFCCFLCWFVSSVLQEKLPFMNFCGPEQENCTKTMCG